MNKFDNKLQYSMRFNDLENSPFPKFEIKEQSFKTNSYSINDFKKEIICPVIKNILHQAFIR